MLSIVTIFTTLTLVAFAGDKTSFLSLGFNQNELAGVTADLETHRQLAKMSGLPLSQITDGKLSKQALLNKIAESVKDSDTVVFMYSGHGFTPTEATDQDYADSQKPINYMDLVDPALTPDQLSGKAVKADPCKPQNTKGFIFGTSQSIACANECRNQCDEQCSADWSKVVDTEIRPEENACRSACNKQKNKKACVKICDDQAAKKLNSKISNGLHRCRYKCENTEFAGKCQQQCADKYAITADDLAKIFKGKKVVGLIDACHSGAIRDSSLQGNFWASAQADSLANDTPQGGQITKALVKNITEEACEFDASQDGVVTLDEALGKYRYRGPGCTVDKGEGDIPSIPLGKTNRACQGGTSKRATGGQQ